MTNIDLSIIIVNYNVKDFLLQCLNSVEKALVSLKNNGFCAELIVIDNNSSDGSVEMLSRIFRQFNFIKLNSNEGYGRANNLGIEKAKGEFVLILNPDTLIEENNLVSMLNFMKKHPDVGIAGCKVLNPDGSFQLSCRRGFPTPWTSFSKLFGLQNLFPKSKLFGRYNQTYKSIDDTYEVDAVGGAYMFARKEALEQVKGFDSDYFMYGEDLDICLRVSQMSWKIVYYNGTQIIHYKGESTRRSSINEVKHFYNAMEIFVSKHYSSSSFFLLFLRLGIYIRLLLAYFNKYKKQIATILFDMFTVNYMLMLGTLYKFGGYFNFPYYAYPTVFIVISLVIIASMSAVGEYFEGKQTIRRTISGYMIAFFIISFLTYYFKEYAFSRGVLLFTIGSSLLISSFFRFVLLFYDKISGKESIRRIALIGVNRQTQNIIENLQTAESRNTNIVGIISTGSSDKNLNLNIPVIGDVSYLTKIIEQFNIHEIIVTDNVFIKNDLMSILAEVSNHSVKFHIANEFEELIIARFVDEVSPGETLLSKYNILKFRYKFIKRIIDIIISVFLLSIGLPVVYLLVKRRQGLIKRLYFVLIGQYSIIGLYDIEGGKPSIGKIGLTGLAHISEPERMPDKAIKDLNDYYLINYNFSLDLDILLKQIFRKKSGN
jgi:GT2 family glycosyltransferase